MSEKRRALGRGLGALIPNAPATATSRPVDVFFPDQRPAATDGEGNVAPEAGDAAAAAEQAGSTTGPQRDGSSDKSGQDAGAGSAQGDATATQDAGTDETAEGAAADTGLAPVPGASYGEIPLDEIRPNPRQPRSVFDEDDMAELVHSIREIGVLQPVVVRPISAGRDGDVPEGVRYELIMGERRWRASREAGKETVPAIVKETEDDDLLRDALLENLHRSQLNPLEEAAAYSQLLEDFGCTHDELAGRIGRSRPQISNTLRLLKLPPMVARRVAAGVLSAGHARALLSLEDGGAMERLAQRIVAEGLSVRSVEEIVALGGDLGDKAKPRRPRAGSRHPQLDDLAARLSDRFDTRVAIALGQRKGKLTVEFASVEDLNRIVDLLGVDPRG
ncbi:ParB/RepB/Spo0J family partition protein [Phycicoccus sp. 3266]|uniref:ParB/RepB/Spo0J family partition protein n=1 Tax=Phycicoccus sp. 3266 TaxID=2817751 RepID=UPI0028644C11|nr:ParB/RepB/Spo0J family partition protein [Phycicoccus sp. 3266]MDR6863217.1 ParB family chromosome partitioning protein [Phycicoccus sp. 3266]